MSRNKKETPKVLEIYQKVSIKLFLISKLLLINKLQISLFACSMQESSAHINKMILSKKINKISRGEFMMP